MEAYMNDWEREHQARKKALEEQRLKTEELERTTISKRDAKKALDLSSWEIEQATRIGRLRCTETMFDSRYDIAAVEELRKEFLDLSLTTFKREQAIETAKLSGYELDARVRSGAVRTVRDPLGRERYLREDILALGKAAAQARSSELDPMEIVAKLLAARLRKSG
jgi:hypothetical protein